jgi:hypothetical protein
LSSKKMHIQALVELVPFCLRPSLLTVALSHRDETDAPPREKAWRVIFAQQYRVRGQPGAHPRRVQTSFRRVPEVCRATFKRTSPRDPTRYGANLDAARS